MKDQLYDAIRRGDLLLVKDLILECVNIKADYNIAVRLASEYGQLDIVKCFISVGVDFKADDYAVCWASVNGHLDIVKYLVSIGADFKVGNDSAVRWASACGHLNTVKYLVSIGADFKADNNDAVRWASGNGHLDTVKYLVSIGADFKNVPHYQLNIIIKQLYSEGHFDKAYEILCYSGCDNENIERSLEKIYRDRSNYFNNIKSYCKDILIIH